MIDKIKLFISSIFAKNSDSKYFMIDYNEFDEYGNYLNLRN